MKTNVTHLYVNMAGQTPCFASITAALNSIPPTKEQEKRYPAPFSDLPPVTLHIGSGVYRERLVLTRPNLTLLGEGDAPADVVITGNAAAYDRMPEGDARGTFRTATVRIDAQDITVKNLTIQNDAGYGHTVGQAIALYADGDRLFLENCRLIGSQDTLFTAPLPQKEAKPGGFKGPGEHKPRIPGRHLYRNCLIQGDVDFIFGGATAWFEGCTLFSKMPGDRKPPESPDDMPVYGYVTAASTPKELPFGYVFHGCRLVSDCPGGTVMLGRPWREWAKTVFLDCELGAHIHPSGWMDWEKPHGHFYYAEYRSKGAGSAPDKRAPFSGQLSDAEASGYTIENVLDGWKP